MTQDRAVSNVIAVKNADRDNADILVISAHHDSVPTAYGANDNASGVTALLAIAEQVKDAPTDTEIRFVSFTDEENGKNGSRYYVSTLQEEERSRIVGNIQLDMLGRPGGRRNAAVYHRWRAELAYQPAAEAGCIAGGRSRNGKRPYLVPACRDTGCVADAARARLSLSYGSGCCQPDRSCHTGRKRTDNRGHGTGDHGGIIRIPFNPLRTSRVSAIPIGRHGRT